MISNQKYLLLKTSHPYFKKEFKWVIKFQSVLTSVENIYMKRSMLFDFFRKGNITENIENILL